MNIQMADLPKQEEEMLSPLLHRLISWTMEMTSLKSKTSTPLMNASGKLLMYMMMMMMMNPSPMVPLSDFENVATATVVAIPRGIFALPCLIADTGASHHMCHLQSAFYSFNPSPLPLNYVVVANERIFEVTGIGNIFCKVFDKIIFLHNVLCVPHLGHMIYSIPQHCLNNNCLVSHSTVGTYLLFPDFSIPLGDRSQARVRYLPDMPDRIDYSDRVTHLFEDSTASTVSLSDSSDSEETLVRTANHMPSSELLTSNFCIIDSGASTHMCPAKQAFISYTVTSHSYVTVANNIKAPCLGKGTAVFYLHNKFIKLDNVLHIPDLNNTLFSISEHRRHRGCYFIADSDGSFLQFPNFRLKVDDSKECTIPIHFLNETPNPLPTLDFDSSSTTAKGLAVTTRSMAKKPPPAKPTTSTPDGFPPLPVAYKQFSSHPTKTRFTTHQLHRYLGSRSLKHWKILNEMSQPSIQVSDVGEIPLEIGDVVNLKAPRNNKTSVPRPKSFLDVVLW